MAESHHKSSLPCVSVGVRFHRIEHLPLLERCLCSVAAQEGVIVHLYLALQDFDTGMIAKTQETAERAFLGSGFTFEVINTPNPEGRDLRSVLLNTIVGKHYENGSSSYLAVPSRMIT